MAMARERPRRAASWGDRTVTIKVGKALARYPYPIVGEGAVLADIASYRYGIEDITSRIIEFHTAPFRLAYADTTAAVINDLYARGYLAERPMALTTTTPHGLTSRIFLLTLTAACAPLFGQL